MASQNGGIPESVPELGPAAPRENLISTAVKFLQNPQTQSSPLDQKKKFLVSKGLTENEIEIAVSRSNISSQPILTTQLTQVNAVPPKPVSAWKNIQAYSSMAIVIGGFVYAFFTIYKKYVEPLFMKHRGEQRDQMVELEMGVKELNTEVTRNLKSLEGVIAEIRDEVKEHAQVMQRVSTQLTVMKNENGNNGNDATIRDLQSQISSLKGLLLNTKQFPAAPVIPSWQIPSSSKPQPDVRSNVESGLMSGQPSNGHIDELESHETNHVNDEESSHELNESRTMEHKSDDVNLQVDGISHTSLYNNYKTPNSNISSEMAQDKESELD
ncbi:peroxisomal membrane protein PEX14-like [Ciona intestinalis]